MADGRRVTVRSMDQAQTMRAGDFRVFALSRLEMTLSVGQAVAFEQGYSPRWETMVSLKILR